MGKHLQKEFNQKSAVETIRQAGDRWPSSFVPRSQIPKFTGGLFAVGTMANMDSEGNGPEDSFRVGRQVCYPVESLCNWLIGRLGC
jgi:hypothetical protein